jgi:excisionase family DNA binding protein
MKNLPDKQLLRPNEVADYFSVTERTVRAWIKKKQVVSIKKGGTIRVLKESIISKTKGGKIKC